jgi:hypothetical protein
VRFLENNGEYRSALRIGIDLARKGLGNTNLSAGARAIFEEAQRQIASEAGEARGIQPVEPDGCQAYIESCLYGIFTGATTLHSG